MRPRKREPSLMDLLIKVDITFILSHLCHMVVLSTRTYASRGEQAYLGQLLWDHIGQDILLEGHLREVACVASPTLE